MAPESNQASITSGTRRMVPPHCLHRHVYSSTYGLWGSKSFDSRRSEEHTSELQSRENLVCRLLLEKKNLYLLHLISHYQDPYKNASHHLSSHSNSTYSFLN